MNDPIEREDAVEIIKKNHYNVGGCGATLKVMIEQIKAIPSADRPRGEWIDRSDGGRILNPWWENYECNRCGYYGSGTWNFCPNCGCRMKGADDE